MERFDPYHTWLGIPPEEQPPNHYRLLGISTFEADRDVIRNAADQRMTYLRTYGGGQHSELSQKLLNEVSAAKVSLVNPDKKAAYDAWLRDQLEPSPADDMAAEPVKSAGEEEEQLDPIVTVLERVPPSKSRKKGRPVPRNPRNDSRYLPWILFAAVLVVAASLWPWPNSGTVRIVLSDPSADVQVRVDGEVVAVSDLKDPLELEAGEHELSVSGPDYESVSYSFTVEQGQETPLRVDLVQLVRVGRVKIAISDPSADVDVKVDGDVIEAWRLENPLKLYPGEYELVITGPGYWDVRQSFAVKSGEEKVLHVELVSVEDGPTSTASDNTPTGGKEVTPEDTPPLALAPFDEATAKKHQRAWADYLAVPVGKEIELGVDVNMSFILIPPGEFMMGALPSKRYANHNEQPQHRVRITKPFYLGVTEVTQGQWETVMGTAPWSGKGRKTGSAYPAVYVSWEDVVEFCEKLSAKKEDATYRLPTEAEWEYACRAGTSTAYSFGNDASELKAYAWYDENTHKVGEAYAHRVGEKSPNPFGLYDMHGNVFEWCRDWYEEDYYDSSPTADPMGPDVGSNPIRRGGYWYGYAWHCRSAFRSHISAGYRDSCIGFRLVSVVGNVSGDLIGRLYFPWM